MTNVDFKQISSRYKRELLENCLPFWLEHSQDKEYGGYFSCLNRDGSVYDTDKFIWLQGREVWMFAMLYNNVEKNQQWLDCAIQGAEFLKKYGHDEDWDFYFSVNREGRPLVQPYNIFSNTFACMAFAQLAKATGNGEYAQIARRIFGRILERRSNPKGQWCKAYPGTRPMNFEGREINPGHDLEALWFMMNLGLRRDDKALIENCVEIALRVIERGWDKEFGGIYYFLDAKGVPQQKLEWDQKLWWVHIESAIAMLKGYQLTGNEKCLEWFLKLDAYIWDNFKDKEYPEWFGYLNRRGEVLLPLKGGKWKGCFHVPRGLYQIWQLAEKCGQRSHCPERAGPSYNRNIPRRDFS